MSTLFDALSNDDKIVAEKIISKIAALQSVAVDYLDEIHSFEIRLARAASTTEFHVIVKEIVEKGNEIDPVLQQAISGSNDAIEHAVDECISNDAVLTEIMNGLRFLRTMSGCILATKERLTAQELFADLQNDSKAVLQKFITDVRALKPVADNLAALKMSYQKRLAAVQSLAEVDGLENEIMHHDQQASLTLKSRLSFPVDTTLSAILNEYLGINHHLKATLRAFNFHAALTDDILAARAENTYKSRLKF